MRIWMLLLALCAAVAAAGAHYRPVWISGSSMSPTFQSHRMALMDLRYARADALRAGDVVVFRHAGETYVKRIYATAGDTITFVRFDCGVCIFSDDDPFMFRKVCRYLSTHPARGRLERMRVPEGCIYVLGDNRNASIDSRDFGAVPVSDVMGRVLSPRRTAAAWRASDPA